MKEELLELFLLEYYKNDVRHAKYMKNVDENKYFTRLQELRNKFLKSYVNDTDLKK